MFQSHADDVINQIYNIRARQKGHPHPFVASAFRLPPPPKTLQEIATTVLDKGRRSIVSWAVPSDLLTVRGRIGGTHLQL